MTIWKEWFENNKISSFRGQKFCFVFTTDLYLMYIFSQSMVKSLQISYV